MRRKFFNRGRNDPTTGRPAVTFNFGDEWSFSKWDIVKILPFPEVPGMTKRQKKPIFSSDFKCPNFRFLVLPPKEQWQKM